MKVLFEVEEAFFKLQYFIPQGLLAVEGIQRRKVFFGRCRFFQAQFFLLGFNFFEIS